MKGKTKVSFSDGHFNVPSSRHGVAPYSVRCSGTMGRWICSCPHWFHRCLHNGEDCKHIAQVREWLEMASMKELEEAER